MIFHEKETEKIIELVARPGQNKPVRSHENDQGLRYPGQFLTIDWISPLGLISYGCFVHIMERFVSDIDFLFHVKCSENHFISYYHG